MINFSATTKQPWPTHGPTDDVTHTKATPRNCKHSMKAMFPKFEASAESGNRIPAKQPSQTYSLTDFYAKLIEYDYASMIPGAIYRFNLCQVALCTFKKITLILTLFEYIQVYNSTEQLWLMFIKIILSEATLIVIHIRKKHANAKTFWNSQTANAKGSWLIFTPRYSSCISISGSQLLMNLSDNIIKWYVLKVPLPPF